MSTLRQILEGPRPVKKSRILVSLPWPEIMPPRPDNSVLEIFGEMEFQERNSRFGSASSSPASTPLTPTPPPLPHYSLNLEQEIEEESDHELGSSSEDPSCGRRMCLRCNSDPGLRVSREGFPDPISIIGKNGKPWLYYESVKKEGRFVLKEVRIPGQGGCMHSKRENGRLLLQLRNPNLSDGLLKGF